MHILFLTRAYSQHAGGMERLSYEMIAAAQKQPGVSVSIIAHRGSRATSPLFNLTALPQALAHAQQADVIHLGDPMLAFLGWLLKLLTKKPVTVTVHGLDITYPNFLYQLYLKLFFRNFDHYLPISTHVAQLLSSRHLPAGRPVSVLTPGVSDRFFDPTIPRDQLAQLLKRDITNTHVLFTSGRLIKRKGHAWFIENVLPKLPQNVLYVIAGEGPEKEKIQSISEHTPADSGDLARGEGILNVKNSQRDSEPESRRGDASANVILLSRVTDDQLKILYNTVDAFIMPNIPVKDDVEGFGLVLLEAALCQRPVFAANLEGIPDAIHDGRNGTLLPPQNAPAWISALKNFLSNPETNPAARDYTIAHFNWQKKAQSYLKQSMQKLRY